MKSNFGEINRKSMLLRKGQGAARGARSDVLKEWNEIWIKAMEV